MMILVEKDTEPLVLQYKVDGVPVNITGFAFNLNIGYTTAPLVKAGVIHDAALGLIHFDWISTDLQDGDWDAEILVTNAAGREKTLKIQKLRIMKRLA
jgi:hypothetical protein